jgi:F420-0:gamma-glutamyl ligase
MKVAVFRTDKITSRSHTMRNLLDETFADLPEGCIVAIAAKAVSLCEGRAIPMEGVDKDALIRQEAQWYLPREGQYELSFTITRNLFIPTAGIDESNANDHYILWPIDPQASANAIREHLVRKHGRKHIGVIITDSTSRPLQWGTTGIAVASSGFEPLKSYIGKEDSKRCKWLGSRSRNDDG